MSSTQKRPRWAFCFIRRKFFVRDRMSCFFYNFYCGCPRIGFCWRRACPSCRGGHLLSLRGESKQRLAKGHLWNPFGEQVLERTAESYGKGAPMKMPTLRVSSGNQSCCPVCRRAFSERSRWLAEDDPTIVLIYTVSKWCFTARRLLVPFCGHSSFSYVLASRAGRACA